MNFTNYYHRDISRCETITRARASGKKASYRYKIVCTEHGKKSRLNQIVKKKFYYILLPGVYNEERVSNAP